MSKGQGLDPLQWYSLSELRGATQNFAPKQLLGKGGSGKVYLGELLDGTRVAVKDIAVRSSDVALEVSYFVSLKMPSQCA
jgi:hypothetical protein